MSSSAAAAAAASSSKAAPPPPRTGKICFNSQCDETKFDLAVKGWRLRSGEFAQLCDRCGSDYAEGKFCEKFHTKTAGWRLCETCKKPLHCGCIVSCNTFVLLDVGGVECIPCTHKHSTMVPNQSWSLVSSAPTERCKDTLENSNPLPIPNGVSRQWWHSANARTVLPPQSELHPRMPYEVERSKVTEKVIPTESSTLNGVERDLQDPSERAVPRSLGLSVLDRRPTNNIGGEMVVALNALHRQGTLDGLQHPAPFPVECGSADARKRVIDTPGTKTSVAGMSFNASSSHQTPSPSLSQQLHSTSQHGVDSSTEIQMRNGKARVDARGRNQLLPRYQPKITNEELQEISGDRNVVITPLFEKILSASDAGRIGRLVLPKRCAEAYFPTITHPEGVPLRVQDAKEQEWVFQFRFWPNNNSRMYVLEGVTPCIQNMQLQAGDTVTFSRKDPDGKLVMGFRKTSNAPPNQDHRKKNGNGVSKHFEQANMKETSTWSEVDKSGYIATDAYRVKPYPLTTKRKNSMLGMKNKRLRMENEDQKRLKLSWDEAQLCICPPLPPNHVPGVMVIDGVEVEEYQEEPVLGEYSAVSATNNGSSLSSHPESKDDQPQEQPNSNNNAASKKNNPQTETDTVEGSEGLDTLANLALLGEADAPPSSAQATREAEAQPPTTKHPRHRAGCTCIVCIQPPSGKGPKHSDSCVCSVCMSVKRRFRTMMERRGKRPPENETGTNKKQQQKPGDVASSPVVCDLTEETITNEIPVDAPFKGGIDLNIQPERDEESSPVSGSECMTRFMRVPPEVHNKLGTSSSKTGGLGQAANSGLNRNVVAEDNPGKGVPIGIHNVEDDDDEEEEEEDDDDYPIPLSVWIPPTTAADS